MNSDEVTFAVLAGGLGVRLGGVAKGLLILQDGETVVERLLRLGLRCEAQLVVTSDTAAYGRFGVPCVADVEPGFGAPGGLVTALMVAKTTWVIAVACDMPFVTFAELAQLLAARDAGTDVACFERDGRNEPLFGLYRRSLGDAFYARLHEQRALRELIESVGRDRLKKLTPSRPQVLDSLNTPADLVRHKVRKF